MRGQHSAPIAQEARRNPQTHDLLTPITQFRKSSDFTKTAPDTRREYYRYLNQIPDAFGSLTIDELQQSMTRDRFKEWHDAMAQTPRAADLAWSILARVLSFARDRGMLAVTICERGGRLSRGTRAALICSNEDLDALRAVAPQHMRLALLMGLWTGQHQSDLLDMPWSAYDGSVIRLQQCKTGARASIPIVAALQRERSRRPFDFKASAGR